MNKPSKCFIVAKNIADNYRFKMRARNDHIDTVHGATHRNLKIDESIRYIETVFTEYLSYSGMRPNELEGKRVLEVGPGDNFGVALRFLSCGASQVICLDRFKPQRVTSQEREIYRALRDRLPENEKCRYDKAIDLTCGIQFNQEKLEIVYGVSIEDAGERYDPQSFDLIVSRAVLMEIPEPDKAFEVMDRLLVPGGFSLHKVAPLCDYMMFRQHGYHPLEFLTVPDFLYRRMVADSGKPNRRLRSYYQSQFAPPRYEAVFHTVALLGAKTGSKSNFGKTGIGDLNRARRLLGEIHPRLPQKYLALPEEDLLVEDLFIVARKVAN